MATLTIEYNSRTKGVQNILEGLLESGIFKIKKSLSK
jgi:predicted transcriptional regulator YheO